MHLPFHHARAPQPHDVPLRPLPVLRRRRPRKGGTEGEEEGEEERRKEKAKTC